MGYEDDSGQYEYYAPSSGLHLESVVPLILILIVGFLIALNLGFLDNIPVIGDVVGSQPVDVLLVGQPSASVRNVLTGVDAKSLKINVSTPIDAENVFRETLANYDIVLLQSSGSAGQYMSLNARKTLADFVDKGGKIILIQNASTKVRNDPSVDGWSLGFGDRVPVTCSSSAFEVGSCTTLLSVQGQFFPLQQNHPIVEGVKQFPAGSQLASWTVLNITATGEQIAFIKTSNDQFYPAIAQKSTPLGGKIVYFNYDPGQTPSVLLNTVEWLR